MKTSNLLGITRADLEAEVGNNWKLFSTGPDVTQVEILSIDPFKRFALPKIFYKGSYSNLDSFKRAMERYAIEMNLVGFNIYSLMNPIQTEFKGAQADDTAVRYREQVLVDIDRAGVHKVPSTEAELQASLDMGDAVAEWLSSRGFPAPIKTCSGNGCHLYYKLHDLENTDLDRDLVKNFLNILAKQFNTADIEIDTVVYNASRITKFLGTIMRKGMETSDRPYRMARMMA